MVVNRSARLNAIYHRVMMVAMTAGSVLNAVWGMGQDARVIEIIILAVLYVLIGTIGWTRLLRQNDKKQIYGYFIIQAVILIALSTLETVTSHKITSGGAPVVPLLLQSAILAKGERRIFASAVFIGQVITVLFFLPLSEVLPPAIFYAVIMYSILYIGRIVEREEEARAVVNEVNRKLTEYTHQAEELAVAKERNRLAREIHDNLGHYLTAVNMQIEAAMAVMNSDGDRAVHALERAQSLTKEGLSEVRRAVAAMRAAPIEARPLHEAIQMLVQENQASGMPTHYQIEGTIRPCSAQVELALYRIAQEGLTNIRKHSRAKRADLILNYCKPTAVTLCVQDDGVGSAQTDSGFGLLGVQERVKLLGGTLVIGGAPGQGFTLQVELPG
jgi:signal transduction histidine kinase